MNTFVQSALGGALIGASAAGLLLVNGRIAGISGILASAATGRRGLWRWAFLGGLVLVGVAAGRFGLAAPESLHAQPIWALAGAGLLVGIGTRWGSGCTSGHGVCGMANLSPRSLVATVVFMVVAGTTVFLTRHADLAQGLLAQAGLS